MKKVVAILSFALVCLFTQLRAQGNLQFNQVKLVTTVQTVPAGKVWKVESAQYGGGATFTINNSGPNPINGVMSIQVNGTTIFLNIITNSGSSAYPAISTTGQTFPIWLPAGSTVAASTNTAYVNVIEFNVVP